MRASRRSRACMAVTIAGLLLPPVGIRAEPEVRESIELYDVRGSTAAQLRRDLARLGPRVGDRKYGGRTTWELTWTYTLDERPAECGIASYDIRMEVTTTLPRWVPDDDVSGKLVARWERFLAALTDHEQGHRRLGLEAATALERHVNEMPAEPTCDELERAIADDSEGIVRSYRESERRYDEHTRHGRSEGARF